MNIVTVEEVSKFLKLSDSTIYKLAQKGKIPAFKLGDSWRFDMNDIVAFVRKKGKRGRVSRQRADASDE